MHVPIRRTLVLAAAVASTLTCSAAPAPAEVRFGQGVRIGGHDVSNRRYGGVHVKRVRRLPGPPGCCRVRHGTYRRGDGSLVHGPMEICSLVAIPPGRRR